MSAGVMNSSWAGQPNVVFVEARRRQPLGQVLGALSNLPPRETGGTEFARGSTATQLRSRRKMPCEQGFDFAQWWAASAATGVDGL